LENTLAQLPQWVIVRLALMAMHAPAQISTLVQLDMSPVVKLLVMPIGPCVLHVHKEHSAQEAYHSKVVMPRVLVHQVHGLFLDPLLVMFSPCQVVNGPTPQEER
jgi:hypothetical protein